jgi:hypothetical protein
MKEGERRYARRDGNWTALEITGYISKQKHYSVKWEDGLAGVVPACRGIFRLNNPEESPLQIHSAPRLRRRMVATSTKKRREVVAPHTVVGKLGSARTRTPLGETTSITSRHIPYAEGISPIPCKLNLAHGTEGKNRKRQRPFETTTPLRKLSQRTSINIKEAAKARPPLDADGETPPEDSDELVFDASITVPAHIDASLIAATCDLETGCIQHIDGITREMVLADHADFASYRIRLLHSMLRRAWFNVLTEFNMRSIFPSSDPTAAAHFVKIIQVIVQNVREELLSLKDPVGDCDTSVAHLTRNGKCLTIEHGLYSDTTTYVICDTYIQIY